MPQVLVIEKKAGCRRPVQRIIAIDDSPSAAREPAQPAIRSYGSWTGQVQGGGGMYYGRRKNKK